MIAADDGSGLADALRGFEGRLLEEGPERVLLADDSDAALAAALVAAKLGIPVEVQGDAGAPASTNGRLIAQLAAPPSQT